MPRISQGTCISPILIYTHYFDSPPFLLKVGFFTSYRGNCVKSDLCLVAAEAVNTFAATEELRTIVQHCYGYATA
ncbi:MAG: hypothetical protein ACXAC5_00030 [Promethearchaeota archaeon]